jgi:hypothetical protein
VWKKFILAVRTGAMERRASAKLIFAGSRKSLADAVPEGSEVFACAETTNTARCQI